MTGSFITVTAADGGKFQAYLATPAKGSGPGIVLLQEIFGVNHHIQAVADYYAEEGYVVLAPELFWRFGSAHPSGCNFVLGDGSVRHIRYTIDPVTFMRACKRDDGQTVDLN